MFVFSSRDDFIEAARNFHGSVSPGLMIGASMVQLALHFMGGSQHFHALCETCRDLPDAVQLLTPCTAGNGRLHILELGRLAVTLFRYPEGKGIRVYLDVAKSSGWPHIRRWASRKESCEEKDLVRLEHEIRRAGISILSASPVQLQDVFLQEKNRDELIRCICCGEPHPAGMGPLCRACSGGSPYLPKLPAVVSQNF